jgi:hypothetical protein
MGTIIDLLGLFYYGQAGDSVCRSPRALWARCRSLRFLYGASQLFPSRSQFLPRRSIVNSSCRALITLVLLGYSSLFAQSVWVADSLQRVRPTDPAGTGTQVQLYAAKGESESFQVIVHAPAAGLSQVNMSASSLVGPGTISPANLVFYREYYVNVAQGSPNFGVGNVPLGAGVYPDGLIPFVNPATGADLTGATLNAVPYNVPANQNQPFWIDVNVPRTAVAGNYTGTVTVTSSAGTWTLNVSLQVWNFTLPVAPNLKSTFGFHSQYGTAANNEVLLENRIQPFIIAPSDVSTLKNYGAAMSGLPYFNQSSGCTIETPPSEATLAAAVAQFPGFPTYVYPADEVNGCANLPQNLGAWAKVAHAAGTKTLVTVIPDPTLMNDGTGTGRSDVDIWAILPRQFCENLYLTVCVENPNIPTVRAKGDETWSYTEQVQDNYSPKWEIDFAPINYRIFPGFINQSFGFTGLLYSDVMHWTSDPWNNVNEWYAAGYAFPGDGLLVYPGTQVGLSTVQPSMRLKYIRDGVDDYDYMAMLKQQGQTAFVQSVLTSIAPDWINWTKNTTTLENARIQLGQKLDALAGGSSTLQAPTLSTPANASTGSNASSLALTWDAVTGATQYQVYFGSTSTALSLYATVTAPTVTSTVFNLNPGATYYWKVTAVEGTTTASSAVWSFTTALAAPTLLAPANGITIDPTSITVQWSSVMGAAQYQVYFGTSATSLALYTTTNAPTIAATISNLTLGTFYWKVVAVAGTIAASSPVWSFTNALAGPTLVSPANGTTIAPTNVTLQWGSVSGVTQYQVYLGSSLANLAVQGTVSASAVSYPLSGLNFGSTYYWKVVGMAGQNSASSSVFSFITPAQPLTAPTAVWPTNGGTAVATSLNVTWSSVSGATQYQFYFGSSPTALSLNATVAAPTTWAPVYNLNIGATYYWQVIATAGSNSAPSAVFSFTTPAPTLSPATLVWPLNGSTTTATSLNVMWSSVTGAAQYQVYLGSAPTSLSLFTTLSAPSTQAPLLNLNPATTYYWQVIAVAGGSSASSATWSFTTPSATNATVVRWPPDTSASNTTSLNLQWIAVPGATTYQIYLGSSATTLTLYTTVNAPVVKLPLYRLQSGATYYWQVVAVVGSTTSTVPIWSFTTN